MRTHLTLRSASGAQLLDPKEDAMRRVIVTEFMSLDGVVEAPEKWSLSYWNDETEKFKNAELAATGALLLGRVTYEGFGASWPSRSGAFADKMNAMPKHVASTTLNKVDWNGAALMRGSAPDAVQRLKTETAAGDLVLHGSATLAQAMMERDLVDVYHVH